MTDALVARLGRDFQAGEALFREGEAGDVMYVIRSGRIRVTKMVDGQQTVLSE